MVHGIALRNFTPVLDVGVQGEEEGVGQVVELAAHRTKHAWGILGRPLNGRDLVQFVCPPVGPEKLFDGARVD